MNTRRRKVLRCIVPGSSAIEGQLADSYFHDAWTVENKRPELTALEHLLTILASTPDWVKWMMAIRNRTVALFGLKNLSASSNLDTRNSSQAYVVGDRIGMFTLISTTPDEVLVGDDDIHLRVVLSLRIIPGQDQLPGCIVLSTVVHVHNLLGRIYMLPVTPMHKLIVPAMLRCASP